MTTLHLLPSSGYQTAAILKQNALTLFDEAQSLRRALQSLAVSWQGGGQDEFEAQANALLRSLEAQAESLQTLAERLEREITEWEEIDRRGAATFRGLSSATLYARFGLPISGGAAGVPFLIPSIPPMFTAVSVASWISGLPAWLNSLLEHFFHPRQIVSPIPEEQNTVRPGELSRLIERKLSTQPQTVPPAPLQENSTATPSAQVVTSSAQTNGYDVYYDIAPKAQGELYGNAACVPTSMSMVLDYYHNQNSANRTASPEELISMLDPGDGTPGGGITLDKLNDDLAELGYASTVRTGSMEDLEAALREGPIIVNVRIGLVDLPTRDITLTGSYNHSILVKAINAHTVLVNDPWSGVEKTFSRQAFEHIWKSGGYYMIIIRPQ